MPFSHLTLTVSHLPSSTSFFLSCLQPLGYQFIGRSDEFIGFGQKPGEPADFWITEQKPGTPAGAAHIAFPAQTKEAVNQFFVRALKAGGKFHGEPRTRDNDTGYFSAAVLDFDGNSIEAVYRSSSSGPDARSEVSVSPRGLLLENGSVVSRAPSSVKQPGGSLVSGYAPPKSQVASSRVGSVVERSLPGPASGSVSAPTYILQEQKPDDGKTAKTIVGTLVGAAAGAAIAYAMIKSEGQSQSNDDTATAVKALPQLVASQLQLQPQSQSQPQPQQALLEQRGYSVIEAAPPAPQSTYSRYSNQPDSRPLLTRSVTSKNPRASTVYEAEGEAAEYYASREEEGPYRRASEGSVVYANSELPLRAIEYPPEQYPCNPPTLISSFTEKSRRGGESKSKSGGSVYSSAATIKQPPKSTASVNTYRSSSNSQHHDVGGGYYQPAASTASAVTSKTYRTTKSGISSAAARNVPLPESVVGPSSSSVSHASSRHSKPVSYSGSHTSRRSSKFDEPVRPCDSVSQVSSNASQRTVRADDFGSRVGSRRGSQVV